MIIRLFAWLGFFAATCFADTVEQAKHAGKAETRPSLLRLSDRTELNLPARLDDLRKELAAPLHERSLRDKSRTAVADREADLAGGYALEIGDDKAAQRLEASVEDFHRFMSVCMGVGHSPQGYKITAECGDPAGCPCDATEAFHLSVAPSGCRVTARDAEGLRRALIFLEDEMTVRRAPLLPLGERRRWAVVRDRIAHSPIAPYRWQTGWELEYEDDFYPDQYLNKLAHCGINGIWVAGLLRRMVASKTLPELGPPANRLETLKRLVRRASRYGIKVYLCCIEPRYLPTDHPVFAAHPEIRGAKGVCLCTSAPLVREYIRETMRELFTAVPELGGVINIFNGERQTTCWLNEDSARSCPRCRSRHQEEVLAEELNCFMEGIRAASPSARLLAWTYSMDAAAAKRTSIDPRVEIMRRADPEITWLVNFEHGGEKRLFGKDVDVDEYSLSYTGPSEAFAKLARNAKAIDRPVYAKLQIGTTYEMGALPELPLPGVVYDKFAAMRPLGVSGAMTNWLVGGYPGVMLKAAGEAAFDPLPPQKDFLQRLAALYYPPDASEKAAAAWNLFAEAFDLYPVSNEVFYYGPVSRSPAYLLHLEREPRIAQPYNFGLDRQRRPQPFEDNVSRWLGPFTAEDLVDSYRKMGTRWQEGIDLLAECRGAASCGDFERQYAVAAAAKVQFLSTANVIEFYTLRDRLRDGPPSDHKELLARLSGLADDDLKLAEEMKLYQETEPAIGYQCEIMDYSFSLQLLDEKIRHTRHVLETLARWQKSGVELDVLKRSLPVKPHAARQSTPASPKDPDPLRWGD